jgi:hypothetical protein
VVKAAEWLMKLDGYRLARFRAERIERREV